MTTLRTFGTYSDTLVILIGEKQADGTYANGVVLEDNTNPGSPVQTPVNWITLGYADNDKLDGKPSGGNQTLRNCVMNIVSTQGNQTATVFQNGVAVPASNLPLVIRSVSPTTPYFVCEGPRVPGVYAGNIISSDVNGVSTEIQSFQLMVNVG